MPHFVLCKIPLSQSDALWKGTKTLREPSRKLPVGVVHIGLSCPLELPPFVLSAGSAPPRKALAAMPRARTSPAAVRGVLVLTTLEAVCAFGYSVYIVVIVSSYETRDSREEYFGAGFLSILAAALLLFVATAVQHGNSYELAAANLISIFLCLGPLLILFKQVRRAAAPQPARSYLPSPCSSLCVARGSPTARERPASSPR